MKPFWEAVNDFLGYAPPEKDGDPWTWTQLLNVTAGGQLTPLIEGIQPSQPGALPPNDPTLSPFYQRSDDVNRLVELTPQPFQTIDVNPADFILAFDNRCVIDQGTLSSLFGQDGASGSVIDQGGPWRTVQVNITGTFLKFEYSQAGRNPVVVTAANRSPTATQIASFFPYLSGNATNPGNYSQNSERNYVIQFGSTKSPVITVRDGDCFNCPFQTVYISFKTLAAPFRLTIGNNSNIKSNSDHRVMNSNIAFGPGCGLWENSNYHAVPFCFTPDNYQNTTWAPDRTLNNATAIWNMITNDPAAASALGIKCPTGTAILWVTSFIAWSRGDNAVTTVRWVLNKSNSAGVNQTIFEAATSGGASNVSTLFVNDRVTFTPAIPVRVLLRQGEVFSLLANNTTAANQGFISWTVNGYIVGGLSQTQTSQTYNVTQQSNRGQLTAGIAGVGAFPTVCFDMDPFPNDPTFSY